MKKLLFLLILTGIFSGHNVFSQVEESPDVQFVIKARPAAESSLMEIARVENNTGFPVRFQPDYSIGNNFVIETWVDGRFYSGDHEMLSNEMNQKIRNAGGAVSINDLCKKQAWVMRNQFNQGNRFREDYLRRLAEQANKKSIDDCNCPNNPDLRENYDRRVAGDIDGLGDGRIYISDNQLQRFPEYEQIITNPEVKQRTWLGRNWWIIPVALVTGYIVADGLSDGEWFEWFDEPFTSTQTIIVYTNPNDPNDPNNPDHNGNGRFFGGGIERPITNIALDSRSQFAIGPPRGIVFGLGF